MIDPHHDSAQSAGSAATDEEIWLLGQPALFEYLEFVKDFVVGGSDLDPAALATEWRSANAYYESLERPESGIADTAECRPLPAKLKPLAAQLSEHPTYRKTYDTLPSEFGMVELDKLVVCQNSVTWDFVTRSRRESERSPARKHSSVLHAPRKSRASGTGA